MTEAEAKTKMCHQTLMQHLGEHNPIIDGIEQVGTSGSPCIGSACMAWRAHTKSWNATTGSWLEPGRLYLRSDIIENRPIDEGHCGLAGKP